MLEQQTDGHPNVLRVLAVATEADAALFEDALRASGLTIHVQRVDTEAALRDALLWEPDVVLTDFYLPGLDALTVIQTVRKHVPGTPVMLVSGAIGEELATEAIKQGAVDFLFKNRLGRLAEAIRAAVAERHLRAERLGLEAAYTLERGLLQSLLETFPDAVYIKDTSLRFQRLNGATARQLGLSSPDEAIGRSDVDFFPAALAAEYAADERRVLASGMPVVGKLEEQVGSEKPHWVMATKVPIRDADGTVIGIAGINRDVTERMRLEAELRASEAKFRSLIDYLPAVAYALEANERLAPTFFSPRLHDLIGYTPEEIIARRNVTPWLDDVHPDDRARISVAAARAVAAGAPFRAEYRHARRDGTYVWVRDDGVPVHDDAGNIVTWYGVLLDISERVQAEQERTRLAAIVESAEDGIASCTLDGIITSWNHGAEKLFGYRADEAIGQSVTMVRPPERITDIDGLVEEVRRGNSIEGHETERITKDGRRIRVSLSISPIRDVNGSIVGIGSILRDVTALRETEAALRESETRFRGVWENTRDAMALSDREGIILAINPAYTDLYGFAPEAIVGQHFSIVYPEAERAELTAANRALFAEPVLPPTFESTIQREDGSVRETEIRISFIEVEGIRQVMVSAIRDVTDRKQLERDLRQALQEAQAATRSKGLFLAMMSHELRTPLQAVLGYSDLLLLSADDTLAPEQREDLGHIHDGAIRMMALIDQLLDLSRLEAGRLEMVQAPVYLPEVIEEVRQDIAPQAAARSLALTVDIAPDLPLVLGDANRLRQVLLNLAGNAVKYTYEGEVAISAFPQDDGVTIAVRDTGIGISPEALPIIFEEFRQVNGGMARPFGGAGLGLAIARRLVEQMGGRITVESQLEQGSTFSVHLGAAAPAPHRKLGRKRGRQIGGVSSADQRMADDPMSQVNH
jgi:PAS domain S-box-containing protein